MTKQKVVSAGKQTVFFRSFRPQSDIFGTLVIFLRSESRRPGNLILVILMMKMASVAECNSCLLLVVGVHSSGKNSFSSSLKSSIVSYFKVRVGN